MTQEGEEVMLKVKLRVRGPSLTPEKVRPSETVNCDQTGARYLCLSLKVASVALPFLCFCFVLVFHRWPGSPITTVSSELPQAKTATV